MNRSQRRAAKSKSRKTRAAPDAAAAPPVAPIEVQPAPPEVAPPSAPPSLILRVFAGIILSNFVLKRVKNAEVERLLASVARQAGKTEIATDLLLRRMKRAAAERAARLK